MPPWSSQANGQVGAKGNGDLNKVVFHECQKRTDAPGKIGCLLSTEIEKPRATIDASNAIATVGCCYHDIIWQYYAKTPSDQKTAWAFRCVERQLRYSLSVENRFTTGTVECLTSAVISALSPLVVLHSR